MKLKIESWHVIVLLVLAMTLWNSWENIESEKKQQEYNEILEELSRPLPMDSASILWEKAYKCASSNNERRLCLGKNILCYEVQNNQSKALELLGLYEDEFEVSTSTLIHKAILLRQIGDEHKCEQILDSIVESPLTYKKPGFTDICMNFFNKEEIYNDAYLDFFFEYICRIVALQYRISEDVDINKRIMSYQKFDKYESIDSYIIEYDEFKKASSKLLSFFSKERLTILQQTHLYLFQNYWNPENAIDDLMRFKWNFYLMYLDEFDRCYGFEKTQKYFQTILTKHKVASEGYQKFLLNAYMESNDINSRYELTYDDYKNLKRDGLGYVVKLSPKTKLDQPSAFINAGVTKPCLVLCFNDWSICDSSLFNRDMVLKNSGKIKHIVILNDDYTLDTLRIKEDKLGVEISYRPVCSMTLDMIRKKANANN